jgi:histidyl-tRNA synthetase
LSSRNAWQQLFAQKCSDPNQAYEFYQAVDKLERDDPAESEAKLSKLGFSVQLVRDFIERGEPTLDLQIVLQNLAARGLEQFVKIDYGVIRGLAYYTGIVFEAFDRKGQFRAIAGGGRYDNLIKLISGGKVNLPALGFGMGDVVLLELLKERKLLPDFKPAIDIFVLIEEEKLRPASLRLVQDLRASWVVDYSLTPAKTDKQFKRALESQARFTAKIETLEGGSVIKLKNLETRAERLFTSAEELAAAAVIGPRQSP